MMLLFSLIVITSLWVLGIKVVTAEGMALESIGAWAEEKSDKGEKWVDPLVYCQWCMPSIHSAVGFVFGWGIGLYDWHFGVLWYYPLVVAGSSLVCGLIWQYYTNKNTEREFYEAQTPEQQHEDFLDY